MGMVETWDGLIICRANAVRDEHDILMHNIEEWTHIDYGAKNRLDHDRILTVVEHESRACGPNPTP